MERIDLGGEWSLTRLSKGSELPMAVPGDIMSSLIASGEIPDPYFDRNELDLQWVGREDWEIVREIDLSPAFLDHERVFLEFEVLDTMAEIRVNGELLGSSSNMFLPFRADAKRLLKAGKNRLSVLIRSPERAAAAAAALLPYPIPYSIYPVTAPNRNLLRKAQCMGGWDWGPCLMTGGIYDSASLLAIDGPLVKYVTTRMRREDTRREDTRRDGEAWRLTVTVWLDSPSACQARLEARVAGAEKASRLELAPGASTATLELDVMGVEPWWPAGYGGQSLYELIVSVGGHELRKRIGFRELEVVSMEDEAGRSMTFRVNGRDVFCKGANWIPADALPSRWTRERLDDLLSSAIEANMNCIRVWGGGRYESENFYGLCDEKGILVWQDCMFSCALYPSSPAFLADVEAETRHQVRRLMDHACIALWCGNNENLGALGWFPESKKNPMRYIVDYDRLYEGTLGRVVRELDPDRTWWPTSPCGGPDDFADNWHGDGRGDMHFWSVWHEGKNFSEYLTVKPRFCSEFGFQSFPSYDTVASFAPEGERNVTSPTLEHHQRHDKGNALILDTMARYFRMPSGQRETLYLSQVQQAMAIKTAVDYWRSLRPLCMGTLYWQLNDVWPVSSWSSLDYDGNWKLLHYEARRFFEPLHLALFEKDGVMRAAAINDGFESYEGRLTVSLRRLDGRVEAEYGSRARVEGESATELWSMRIADLPCAPEEATLDARLTLTAAGGTELERRALAFLTEPKRYSFIDPRIELEVEEDERGPIVAIHAEKPAFFVALKAERGRFEDSGLHLLAGEERRVRFMPARGTATPSAANLAGRLRSIHLRASYE
jgi:beta-mannosidase